MEKLISRLEQSVAFAIEQGDDMDDVSWGMQEGILISYNEAKAVIEALKAFKISSNVPVISSFVCGHPPKQTYLNDGVYYCEKCGGKWNSIANK